MSVHKLLRSCVLLFTIIGTSVVAQTPPNSAPAVQSSFIITTALNWQLLQAARNRASCTIYNLSPTDTYYIYFGTATPPANGALTVFAVGIPITPNGGYYDCHHQAVENNYIYITSGNTNLAPLVWTYQ